MMKFICLDKYAPTINIANYNDILKLINEADPQNNTIILDLSNITDISDSILSEMTVLCQSVDIKNHIIIHNPTKYISQKLKQLLF